VVSRSSSKTNGLSSSGLEVQEIQELVVQWYIRKFRNTGVASKWFHQSKWIKRCWYIRSSGNTGVSGSRFIRKYRS
jgi:hypothetical protein